MDHMRMARRMGLPLDDFWSLSPVQFQWFVDDWWDEQVAERLQMAQLEASMVNIARWWGVGPNDPQPESVNAMDLVVMKRPDKRPGMVKTVEGWVSEETFKLSQARIQRNAAERREDRIAGIYRG